MNVAQRALPRYGRADAASYGEALVKYVRGEWAAKAPAGPVAGFLDPVPTAEAAADPPQHLSSASEQQRSEIFRQS